MPCYYSNEIIIPALEKIANQTVINNITLIMVNDCSPYTSCEYQDLIEQYSNRIRIKYLKTETNSGPGIARQLGLDNATSDWVIFHDDDDELYDNYVIENYLKAIDINEKNLASVTGKILNKCVSSTYSDIIHSSVGAVNSTLFNRQILKNLNIHFEPNLSFCDEDGCFEFMFEIYTRNYHRKLIDKIMYVHQMDDNKHDSLTALRPQYMINILLNFIGFKAYSLKYLTELSIYDEELIYESIGYIPNVTVQFYSYLTSYSHKITQTQYQQLQSYIDIYFQALKFYHIDYYNIDSNKLQSLLFLFKQDNSYYF